jgi:hypothetical protein
MVFLYQIQVKNMKDIMKIIKEWVKVFVNIQMVINILVFGAIIKNMEKVF